MKKPAIRILAATAALSAALAVHASEEGHARLPAGPIHDRHELMEGVGDNAKLIGDSLKAGNLERVASAARDIQAAMGKALPLFPKGSTHPDSRAKDEIWSDWAKFEQTMKDCEARAGELVAAASSGGDASAASKAMFGACKSCHDGFRKPDEKAKD